MVDIGFWGLPKQGEMEQMTQDGCGNWGLARKSMNVRGINNKKSDQGLWNVEVGVCDAVVSLWAGC